MLAPTNVYHELKDFTVPIATESLVSLLQYPNRQFIECAYQEFFRRSPDSAGLAYYMHRLEEGAGRIQILFELFTSPECSTFDVNLPGLREQFLRASLVSLPDDGQENVSNNIELVAVAEKLLKNDDASFVEAAFETYLKRPADSESLLFYTARLRHGVSKVQILDEIIASPEYQSLEKRREDQSQIKADRRVITNIEEMHRTSGPGPANDLTELMQHNGRDFVDCAYLTLLKRLPDSDGLDEYLSRLLSGDAKIQILREISRSDEGREKRVELPGLQTAATRYAQTQIPIVGGLYARFFATEKNSPDARRLRALEQKNFERFQAICTQIDRAEQRIVGETVLLDEHTNARLNQIEEITARSQQLSLSTSHTNKRFDQLEQSIANLQQASLSGAVRESRFDRLEKMLFELQQTCLFIEQLPSRYATKAEYNASKLVQAEAAAPITTFFTICSKNFTAYTKTLFNSIKLHHPNAEMFMFLCDGIDSGYDPTQLPFKTVSLADLDIPDVRGMAERYNITEFNTSIKPYAFSYLFKKLGKQQVIYLDPDIILTSPLTEVMEEFARGTECLLTPHILGPAEKVEVSDNKMLLFGIYNLGFIGLRNTPCVTRVVEWWGRRLEHECVIDLPNGLFVDQKWADLLPAFIGRTTVLHHPGYNVAYWNLSQRTVELVNGVWYSNRQPLRFVHFSGNKLDDPQVLSRHAGSFNRENIGDLKYLLDSYREAVYANGHAAYLQLPYSFSWNGASGINLHTPAPVAGTTELASRVSTRASAPQWLPRLLLIDWSTPRPDRDAGSVTAFYLLKTYVDLGYDVTFIPSDLQYLGRYTEAVEALGVTCLHKEQIGTVKSHLQQAGTAYQIVLICRAPVAALYLPDIRAFAPHAKIILNTSDLHYLRDEREAEIEGDPEKVAAAARAKQWELDILSDCDITIVMSTVERNILRRERPNLSVKLIPLMFVETPPDCPSFERRADILFIGGFPHAPNVDAVIYFCTEIFPLVQKQLPNVTFHIVGNEPPDKVKALAKLRGVVVHGYVEDVEPLFRRCRVSVAPLRYGAGIKGKIGTSLSFGVPVVATSIAVEGMEVQAGKHVLVEDSPQFFADAIASVYDSQELWTRMSAHGRDQMLQVYSPAAGRQRIDLLMRDVVQQNKHWSLYSLRSFAEYCALIKVIGDDILTRRRVESALIKHESANFFVEGFCAVCGSESTFNTSFMYSYELAEDAKPIPNWREHLDCVKCGFTNRIRAALHILYSRMRPPVSADIYITEESTRLFQVLRAQFPKLVGSEYLGDQVQLGARKNGLRNEDLTKLTFADESFDFVLSFDVMEHVSDDIAALREVFRCLKPGGTFLFAAPFSKDRQTKVVRAVLQHDGTIEHILPAEYHGNPVDHENGALCFRYFAWDLVSDMKAVGFQDPQILHYWSRDYAYFGVEQFIFIGRK